MNQRAAYLFQVTEKIGVPLLAAAESRASADDSRSEATIVAELLARAVQAGVELAGAMDIRETGAEGESVRLALAGMAGPLVAGHYRNSGKVPGEPEVKRLVTALSAALTFADNFSPAAGNTARLAALEAGMPPADDTQVMIQCLQALVPMVVAISAYPFGRPERKMVQDVTERLVQQAGNLAARLMPGEPESDLKLMELVLLRAMVPLYCAAHQTEMQRVMKLDDNARQQAAQANGGVLPLEPVWQSFDKQVAMLDVLAQSLAGRFVSVRPTSAGTDDRAPPAPGRPAIPAETPVIPPSAAPVAPVSPPAESGPYNPMAFFKPGSQRDADGENT